VRTSPWSPIITPDPLEISAACAEARVASTTRMIATFLIPTDPTLSLMRETTASFAWLCPPMLWPLNSALTQVAVNGLAEAADAANIAKLPELLKKP
jgi:hypothetical protein